MPSADVGRARSPAAPVKNAGTGWWGTASGPDSTGRNRRDGGASSSAVTGVHRAYEAYGVRGTPMGLASSLPRLDPMPDGAGQSGH
ncbi:hypothetical protein, partial [Streptomyces sp. S1]|uniref:hypothetical protein n=1 Tax=Streptomyces sp. S1 TaxID=718288 RepID=UPI001969B31C